MAIAISVVCDNMNAQTISGKVLNESGLAAANITVSFTDKSNSISTNKDGSFKIVAKKLPDTLLFTAIGFEPYKVVVTEKTLKDPNFEIVLLNKRSELSEVVVASYSVEKKKSYTPSTTTVAGSVFGTEITKSSTSSSIMIRGSRSMSETSSLDRIPPSSTSLSSYRKTIFSDSIKNAKANYATKLLTAGEINDFKKWNLWSDYADNEFKAFTHNWSFYTKQRFTVQLQNNQKYAVVGQKVFLIDNITKDTAWEAITDNTGKAELWGNANNHTKNENNYSIYCNGYSKVNKPYLFEQGINRMNININCTVSNAVDIAFVVDATGSMGDEIEYLKLELEDVINNTFAKYNNLDVKAASVFYRDNGDEYLTKHVDFNNNLLKTLNFIKLQTASGGGDMPEAVNSALTTALDSLHWSNNARTKLMFLILDAPPHPETKDEIFTLTKRAAAMGVRIIPIVCSGADKNTEFIMRSMALATNGTYLFLTDDSGIGGEHIKPTTDTYNIELLNSLLPRIIQQFVYVVDCNNEQYTEPPMSVVHNIQNIKVSPNPTTGKINISSNKTLKELYVADFTGKILMRIVGKKDVNNWSIDIGHFPSGTYIIKYITEENEWGTEKVILVH